MAAREVDWSKSIRIAWDEKRRENSTVRVSNIKVPADPPTVGSRRALWEINGSYPRVFGAAYRFPLDTIAINRGLKDGRGRTLVARQVGEPSQQMPLAVICWHLSQRMDEPLLVVAASPRLKSSVSPTQEVIIETGFQLLVNALLYVASDHRAWVLRRLPSGVRHRKKAEAELGSLLFDVEGQQALTSYLRTIYGARLSVAATKGSGPTLLRLAP